MDNIPSLWNNIAGHHEIIERLRAAAKSGQLSHAYLFVGPRGIGKHAIATALAASINCSSSGCGQCDDCRGVMRRTYRDVIFIEPVGNYITIDQIREVNHLVQLRSAGNGRQIVIIDDAATMKKEAANSLLKTLEDPPGDIIFILIAGSLEALLPTIVSRCQLITFGRLGADEIKTFLSHKHALSPGEVELITRLSRGVLAEAVALAGDASFSRRRRLVLTAAESIGRTSPAALSILADELVDQIRADLARFKEEQQGEFEELEAAAPEPARLERLKKQLAKRHKRELARLERRAFNDILMYLNSYYRDALLLAGGGDPELLINFDIKSELEDAANAIGISGGLKALGNIREASDLIIRNVDPALALETLFFRLREAEAN